MSGPRLSVGSGSLNKLGLLASQRHASLCSRGRLLPVTPTQAGLVVAAIEVRAVGDVFATFLMILVWCIAVFGSAVTLIGLAFDAAKRKSVSNNTE
jgi:hypothetical protein